MKEFKPYLDKEQLRRHMGSMGQLAGLRKYRLDDGRASGVEAVDVRTGGGLEYTVLPGRGMDIAWTSYKGVPVSYMSNTGVSSAALYESEGMEWLRGFFAGMLTTCGFANVGGPCEGSHPVIGRRSYGLHGRLTTIPASEMGTREEWVDGEYRMCVTGKMRESIVHGENMSLRRSICSTLGGNRIELHDVIENESTRPQPMMLLYHMNLGYPVLSPDTRLVTASESIRGASEEARAEMDIYDRFEAPVAGRTERCYFHVPMAGEDGLARVAVVNDALELGVMFSFRPEQLPCMCQWKMLNEGEYVLGIEPGNTYPTGRANAEENGSLDMLSPGEIRKVDITIEILDGAAAISGAEELIAQIKKART
ncbi:MAG: aldose 1-epimerase family protein [Clostridia bacterium]|nr:aldose 1-epimerase family protein [Clostridia bacterium]